MQAPRYAGFIEHVRTRQDLRTIPTIQAFQAGGAQPAVTDVPIRDSIDGSLLIERPPHAVDINKSHRARVRSEGGQARPDLLGFAIVEIAGVRSENGS